MTSTRRRYAARVPRTVCAHVTIAELAAAVGPLARELSDNKRAVLVAPPGVGKTTKLPVMLLEAARSGAFPLNGAILVLEPRRVAAVAAAHFIASTLGEPVGQTVGYHIRGDRRVGPRSQIIVITERLLVRRLQRDPELVGVGAVVFDEVHERSLSTDLGLALVLDAANALRDDLHIIAMSATPDVAALSAALSAHRNQVTTFEVTTAHHEVVTHHVGRDHRVELEDAVCETVVRALAEHHHGDVLVFLPGRREIRRTAERLAKQSIPTLMLWGGSDSSGTDVALQPASGDRRRVILSTAVAQTSLTVDGVRIVIDAGLERIAVHDRRRRVDELVTQMASRAAVDQRRGRAGRQAPGVCYRLWSADDDRHRRAHSPAEIDVADLSSVMLDLAHWGVGDPDDLVWLSRPDPEAASQARSELVELGCLDADGRITELGRGVVELGVEPRLGVMLATGQSLGEGDRAALLAAVIEDATPGDLARALERPSPAQRRVAAQFRRGLDALAVASPAVPDALRPQSTDELVALLVARAFPERVARRREGSDRFVTVGGLELDTRPSDSGIGTAEWLAVAGITRSANGTRVASSVPLHGRALDAVLAATSERARLDVDSAGRLSARLVTHLGAITLADRPGTADRAQMLDATREFITKRGMSVLSWDDSARLLQARASFARGHDRSVADLSDDGLCDAIDRWLEPLFDAAFDGRRLDVGSLRAARVLDLLIDWPTGRRIDALAPPRIAVPSGREVAVSYGPEGPAISVKLQEMFGASDTPTVAEGRVPLVVHLLSPAGRPLQVTSDLAGFWSGSYRAVRSEMRGRYPKHPWPEDPANATATAQVQHPRRR